MQHFSARGEIYDKKELASIKNRTGRKTKKRNKEKGKESSIKVVKEKKAPHLTWMPHIYIV